MTQKKVGDDEYREREPMSVKRDDEIIADTLSVSEPAESPN